MMYQNKRKNIYILRGLPYAGRGGKARKLKRRTGVIISTFAYFRKYYNSQIIPKYLHKAHMWARSKALENIERGVDPVIINNSNMPRWHMYPYARMAFRREYWVKFIEMKDTWNVSLEELERRGGGTIPLPILEDMKESYEPVRHVYDVLNDKYSRRKWIGSKEMTSNDW
ncbi:NEDD4-binding protein 2-like 1 isoform X2 [Alosa sapidissima]|uniref:NEDD4-binding protein 2-like 1 isoform X2 n=1 Tax=Alosa sapidissima TaxID=34773 RepID=UPI001C09C10A|nr:NEDD4-binding protein 2-like 1 isoform X2 [Alosa sapidissima]